MKYITYLLLL